MQVAGDIDTLLATHHRLTGPRRDPARLPADQHVVSASHTDRQSTLLVRTDAPIHDPAWTVSQLSLEDLVLAYMGQTAAADTGHSDQRRPGGPAMIWLTWRQFRGAAAMMAAALAALAAVLALTGPRPGRRLLHRDRRLHHPGRRLLRLRPSSSSRTTRSRSSPSPPSCSSCPRSSGSSGEHR